MPQSEPGSLARLFQECRLTYETAAKRPSEKITEVYALGSYALRLHLAHEGMRIFTSAFRHLPEPKGSEKNLDVYFWDSAASGIPFPFMPLHEPQENGKVQQYRLGNNEGLRFLYGFLKENASCQAVDFSRNEAVFWTDDYTAPLYADCASPLFSLLSWWLRRQGMVVAHAGALGKNGKGLLIAGGGGSGKTTVCLSGLLAGMDFLGDDHIIMNISDTVTAYSLYNSVKLTAKSARFFEDRLPDPAVSCEGWEREKKLVFLEKHFRRSFSPALDIRGIIFPKVTGCLKPQLRKIGAGEALRLLAPSTVLQLSDASSRDLQMLGILVKRLPCRVLELGAGMEYVPGMLEGLLKTEEKFL